jgi:hypothetical protein
MMVTRGPMPMHPTQRSYGESATPTSGPRTNPFPLTPLEAWYLLQGWEVAPAAGITGDQVMKIPAKAEGGNGGIVLWRS